MWPMANSGATAKRRSRSRTITSYRRRRFPWRSTSAQSLAKAGAQRTTDSERPSSLAWPSVSRVAALATPHRPDAPRAPPRPGPASPQDPKDRWSPSRRQIQIALARKLPSKSDGKPETTNPRFALHPSPRDSRQGAATDPRLSNRRVD
jgi:hypothetical protein